MQSGLFCGTARSCGTSSTSTVLISMGEVNEGFREGHSGSQGHQQGQPPHRLEHVAVELVRVFWLGEEVGKGHHLMPLFDGQLHGIAGILPAANQADHFHK